MDWPLAAVLISAIISAVVAYCTKTTATSDADLQRIYNDLRTRLQRLEDKQDGKAL